MTFETHIVARRGYMDEAGELVTTRAVAVAVELETGLVGEAEGENDEEASEAAAEALGERIRDRREQEELARRRAAEDPMARLARLEAIVKERGLDA